MDQAGGPFVAFEPVGYADYSYWGFLFILTGLCIIYTVLLVLGTGGPWDRRSLGRVTPLTAGRAEDV